jgi:membrane protease YdiL (CAAX protease family)
MLLIAAIHTLLVDVGKASHFTGGLVAIVVSALLFMLYHPLRDVAGDFSMRAAVFYFMAGLYFGAVFVSRGFGIVVAVHALYDVATIVLEG